MAITPLGAIKEKCLACSKGSEFDVRNCELKGKCALYPFRLGVIPLTIDRKYSDDVVMEMKHFKEEEIKERNSNGKD